jgi:DNA helicase-2/ATP-dependent DNA helicase PcrA
VFAARVSDHRRVDIRTIDSLIAQISSMYHAPLGLPADAASWARGQGDAGYRTLAERSAKLLARSPMVAVALAQRYPLVICDEHQDCSADQHAVVMAIHATGASLRLFGDPMQCIGRRSLAERAEDSSRWNELKARADVFAELDYPHRWEKVGKKDLGDWILRARATLRDGGRVDLRSGLPREVSVIFAENEAPNYGGFRLAPASRRPIDDMVGRPAPLLVLSAHNNTVQALRSFFNRRLPVWEGHTRDALSSLVNALEVDQGNPTAVASAAVSFVQEVSVGFTQSGFTNVLLDEVAAGCSAKRKLKRATLQDLGKFIIEQPDHRGVARMLERLSQLIANDRAFSTIVLDHPREFREAIHLGGFDQCNEGLAEIGRRRTYARPMPPTRALSTVHKAKGLEWEHVVVMPCDRQHFADTPTARCLLYVAMSRATCSLTLVVSRKDLSSLLIV